MTGVRTLGALGAVASPQRADGDADLTRVMGRAG